MIFETSTIWLVGLRSELYCSAWENENLKENIIHLLGTHFIFSKKSAKKKKNL